MAVHGNPEEKFDLELALNGPDPAPDLPVLLDALNDTGADRVHRVHVAVPAPGKRDAGIVDIVTIAVGGVANLVAVVDTVYKWLAHRRSRAAELPAAEPEENVPSVTITSGEDSVTITYPPDWLQTRAVEEFLRRHGQERPER
ncbi:MAG: effector-associated constant component EACC1 [Catenulispora sp.]